MFVDVCKVEFASQHERDRTNGVEVSVTTGLAFGSLKQPVDGRQKSIGLAGSGSYHDAVKCERIILATAFIGSTLDRMTLTVHCQSISRTTWICLRSRISLNCFLQSHARAVRLDAIWATNISRSALASGLSESRSLSRFHLRPLSQGSLRCSMRRDEK